MNMMMLIKIVAENRRSIKIERINYTIIDYIQKFQLENDEQVFLKQNILKHLKTVSL